MGALFARRSFSKAADISKLQNPDIQQAFDADMKIALQKAVHVDHHKDWVDFRDTIQALQTRLLPRQQAVKHIGFLLRHTS